MHVCTMYYYSVFVSVRHHGLNRETVPFAEANSRGIISTACNNTTPTCDATLIIIFYIHCVATTIIRTELAKTKN